jgi:hypothetical protein
VGWAFTVYSRTVYSSQRAAAYSVTGVGCAVTCYVWLVCAVSCSCVELGSSTMSGMPASTTKMYGRRRVTLLEKHEAGEHGDEGVAAHDGNLCAGGGGEVEEGAEVRSVAALSCQPRPPPPLSFGTDCARQEEDCKQNSPPPACTGTGN